MHDLIYLYGTHVWHLFIWHTCMNTLIMGFRSQSCENWFMSHIWPHLFIYFQWTCHGIPQPVVREMIYVTHMTSFIHVYPRTCHGIPQPVVRVDQGLVAHIWMSHVTHMIESWHTNKWGMAHTWTCHGILQPVVREISHGTRMTSFIHMAHIYKWTYHGIPQPLVKTDQGVVVQIWMSHVTHMTSCIHTAHTYKWTYHGIPQPVVKTDQGLVAHIWMSYVTHMNESCHTYDLIYSYGTTRTSRTRWSYWSHDSPTILVDLVNRMDYA